MTYEEQLKQMNNKRLLKKFKDLQLSKGDLLKKRGVIYYKNDFDCEAELLSRLNRDPMDENCGSCKHSTFRTSEQGKNAWNCKNKESFLYDAYVNKTIHCTEWEKDEEGG